MCYIAVKMNKSVCLVSFNNVVKRLLNLKKCLKKKTEIVFIEVHLETGHYLTVVQRFKVTFIREIWLPETGRFNKETMHLNADTQVQCVAIK